MNSTNFINPYNFIPLGEKRANEDRGDRTLTGVIRYSVFTKTPLFIPNTSNDKTFQLKQREGDKIDPDHKSYDFFSYHNLSEQGKTYENEYFMPVIPGSEMRGMIRSNYEILTNSCLSALDSDTVLSKRTAETFQPALIKKNTNGTYDLYGAKDYLWRTKGANSDVDELEWKDEYYTRKCYRQDKYKEGCRVYFDIKERDGRCKHLASKVSFVKNEDDKKTEGYIIKGEDGPVTNKKGEKHCCHIFVNGGNLIQKNISLETLDIVLKEYKNNGEHEYGEYTKQLSEFKKSDTGFFPVYFSNPIKKHIMLSPACITREIYKNKLKDLVGDFKTCTDSKSLCPACSLFGMIGKDFQVSSRLRFSDLNCTDTKDAKSCYDNIVTLKPLSTPKLNNMEFYLQKPEDAWFWTYDYYIDSKGSIKPYNLQINGRKFYWHQMKADLPKNVERTKLNMTIRPVRSKLKFSGAIYFQKLTQKELDQLLWILNTGDKDPLDQKRHGYKLGAAKPLGLGSVALSVDEVCLRKIVKDSVNHTVRMEEEASHDKIYGSSDGFEENILKNFEKMTSFDTVKDKMVSYPIKDGKRSLDAVDKGYEWFVQNHKGYDRKKKKDVGMPNSREQMYYKEYMKAMEPELVETENIGSVNQLHERKDGISTNKSFSNKGFNQKGNQNRNKNRKIKTAKVKETENNGLVIDVNGEEGYIRKNDLAGSQPVFFRVDQNIKVEFLTEKVIKGVQKKCYKLIKD